MSKTRIFVSLTCYDLAAVREVLREHIMELGHDPLLSEYPSFPVNPDENAIANCKKNVQKNTDILVLIIGGRRGGMDTDSGRSITNSEYESARQHRIPCFVFINRSVNTLLPVWKKNPAADFSPTVDYPEVFQFIERIQKENRWTFTFEKAAEIAECLSIQLSVMLRELLERTRDGKIDPVPSYANEAEIARRLAQDKPQYWEFLLTGELLKSKLIEVRKRFERQKAGLVHVPAFNVSLKEFPGWIQAKLNDLTSLVDALQGHLPIIRESWGPLGQPGDAQEIKRSVDGFIRLCDQLVDWEGGLRAALPPEPFRRLKDTLRGWTEGILTEMERLPRELLQPFEGGAKPASIDINLVLNSPPLDEFMAELDRLRQARLWG